MKKSLLFFILLFGLSACGDFLEEFADLDEQTDSPSKPPVETSEKVRADVKISSGRVQSIGGGMGVRLSTKNDPHQSTGGGFGASYSFSSQSGLEEGP